MSISLFKEIDVEYLTTKNIEDAINATEYKYFGDYEFSDRQRDAVETLVSASKELLRINNGYSNEETKKSLTNYTKIPVEIQAMQLTNLNVRQVYEFIYGGTSVNSFADGERWDDYVRSVTKNGLRLKTLESDGETQVASIGDYIIKGIQGEFYPCKPDVFELTYRKS